MSNFRTPKPIRKGLKNSVQLPKPRIPTVADPGFEHTVMCTMSTGEQGTCVCGGGGRGRKALKVLTLISVYQNNDTNVVQNTGILAHCAYE